MSMRENNARRRRILSYALNPRVLADVARDARHGLRALRRTPVFTAVAVLTLALGIGANTVIFSIVNGVLLRPLAYPRPAQLMYLDAPGTGASLLEVSVPEYLEFQRFNTSFSQIGAFRIDETNLAAGDRAVRVRTAVGDASLMQALGVQPIRGRLFAKEETGMPTPAPVAILSYGLWQSAFGGQPVVGQHVDLGGRRAEIIGILPTGTDLMDTHTELWVPLPILPEELGARANHNLRVIGRLKDGVTMQAAQAELRTLVQTWAARANVSPGARGTAGHVFASATTDGKGHYLRMTPLAEQILGRAGRSIWVLQAGVALVLVIACANIANLLIARAESRQHEFAVLTALGAGRAAILRKALTESVLLALAGCALAVVSARVGLQALIRAYPDSLPRIEDVGIDTRVLVVSVVVAVICGLLFGLAPMVHTRADIIAGALKSGARGSSRAARRHWRHGLVVAETALTVIVAIGAGLLLRTVHNLTAVDAGFQREHLLTFSITLPLKTNDARTTIVGIPSAKRSRTYQRIVEQLRTVPGVRGASAVTLLPLDRSVNGSNTEVAGADQIGIDYPRVLSNFFETMNIPIVHGRSFELTDATSGSWVTVVNEALANTQWKGQNPIGQRLRPAGTKDHWFTVVGVAKDVKQASLDRTAEPEAYILVDQFVTDSPATWVGFSPAAMNMVVRTTLPLSTVAPAIRAAVRDIDPTVPVARLREMDTVVARTIERPRLLAQLLSAFAGLALLLAAIGTYGVLAYIVAERRREMGIRLALGATRGRVLGLVMKHGLMLAGTGVMVGLFAALGLARLLATLLFDVQPSDPMTVAIVIPSIIVIAAMACWFPAWRASRVDPSVVLRAE
jgi:putative ABC transport system permease protein